MSDRLPRVYVASKSEYGHVWRAVREEQNNTLVVTSTWIDESGEGESLSISDLWERCIWEAANADVLIAVHYAGEIWKGVFVEIGAALANGVPIFLLGDPPGSWANHPLVEKYGSFALAIQDAKNVPLRTQHFDHKDLQGRHFPA